MPLSLLHLSLNKESYFHIAKGWCVEVLTKRKSSALPFLTLVFKNIYYIGCVDYFATLKFEFFSVLICVFKNDRWLYAHASGLPDSNLWIRTSLYLCMKNQSRDCIEMWPVVTYVRSTPSESPIDTIFIKQIIWKIITTVNKSQTWSILTDHRM